MKKKLYIIKMSKLKEFVYKKRNHYPSLRVVTTFIIPSVPAALTEGNMDDPKLTVEEYKIRNELKRRGIPFTLVQAQHGLWSQEIALIALERDPSE
jgi:hypothetical protein